jgi:16S rRNA (cytidine1402-2'-O)-methyltransferase
MIQAFSGPSSIFLSLILSGLPGQRFAFHGYLAKEQNQYALAIKALEQRSKVDQATQIFIETPYRNEALLKTLVDSLLEDTLLACAWELTLPNQGILSQPISFWKKSPLPALDKKNAIFLLYRK